jgi:hypothetical protein
MKTLTKVFLIVSIYSINLCGAENSVPLFTIGDKPLPEVFFVGRKHFKQYIFQFTHPELAQQNSSDSTTLFLATDKGHVINQGKVKSSIQIAKQNARTTIYIVYQGKALPLSTPFKELTENLIRTYQTHNNDWNDQFKTRTRKWWECC